MGISDIVRDGVVRRLIAFRSLMLTAALALLTCPSAAAFADYDAGQQAWDAGRPAEALEHWRLAADAGDDRAMLALGRLFVQGLGAPQDFVEAHMWFNLAASRGNAAAAGERDTLGARMTPQQVAAAQERAAAWQPGDAPDSIAAVPAEGDAGPPPVEALREAQTLLSALGYAPGPADGVWGTRSVQAYRAFLRDIGQPDADTLTPETLQAMRDLAPGQRATRTATLPDPVPDPVGVPASRPVLPSDALHRAVQAGGLDALAAALADGAEVDGRDGRGWTALMHAANDGHPRVVAPLLEAGAGVDVRAPDGATALFIAALHGHAEVIGKLLEAGADASIPGPRGRTPQDLAKARYGDMATARRNGESLAVQALIQGVSTVEARELARSMPGGTFRDCEVCPEMVVVPAGSFMMGSPRSEEGRHADESPAHRVMIPAAFAVGRHEVTRAEWDACWASGGCRDVRYEYDRHRGRDHPVIWVSWDDAQAYVRWLSQKTGERYRLLSEAEWEYAARAGSQAPYAWGDRIGHNRANCYRCGSRWDNESAAPVGSFAPNAFGLHDLHGNVSEWVEDCYSDSYEDAPSDGAARIGGDCDRRVIRGGSWYRNASFLRSANRDWVASGLRSSSGIRVARPLAP
ncbi:MAG: SUMF1/EgtB/PvdO family nonheme iron enzyme [Chloroflexi bacterium]|nr:SUMF1/EgtB/PvdO family nonheme iron enzyme [Chloroflexota bacterium]